MPYEYLASESLVGFFRILFEYCNSLTFCYYTKYSICQACFVSVKHRILFVWSVVLRSSVSCCTALSGTRRRAGNCRSRWTSWSVPSSPNQSPVCCAVFTPPWSITAVSSGNHLLLLPYTFQQTNQILTVNNHLLCQISFFLTFPINKRDFPFLFFKMGLNLYTFLMISNFPFPFPFPPPFLFFPFPFSFLFLFHFPFPFRPSWSPRFVDHDDWRWFVEKLLKKFFVLFLRNFRFYFIF